MNTRTKHNGKLDKAGARISTGRTALLLAGLLLAAVAFQGCGGGGGGSTPAPSNGLKPGTGAVRLALATARTAASGRTASVIPSGTTKIFISIHGQSESDEITQTITDISSTVQATILNIPVGVKTVYIAAEDDSGNVLAVRQQIVTIEEGVFKDIKATLGYTVYSGYTGGIVPSSLEFTPGDALVVKNSSGQDLSVYVYGPSLNARSPAAIVSECPSMVLGDQGQIKCFPVTEGTHTIYAGNGSASAAVGSGSLSSLKAGISADVTYGEAPLEVSLLASVAAPSGLSGSPTYSWNLGGGDLGSGSSLSASGAQAVFDAPGDYTVTLTATQGGESVSDTVLVTVVGALAPVVSQVYPPTHENTLSGSLAILGQNFKTGAVVKVGSTAVEATVQSSYEIIAVIPAGFAAGTYTVTVTNPDGQSGSLSNAFTVTAPAESACPPDGDYWMVDIGGDSSHTYSESGASTFSSNGTVSATSLLYGDNQGISDSTETGTAAVSGQGGVYTIDSAGGDVSKAVVNNDCSFIGFVSATEGQWGAGYLAKKGTAGQNAVFSADGTWHFSQLSITSGGREVIAGTFTLSGGNVEGIMHSINQSDLTEQTATVSQGSITYTYNSTTGAVTVTSADAEFTGGLSSDGAKMVLASTKTGEQSILVFLRVPGSFATSDLIGQWRGAQGKKEDDSGKGALLAVVVNSTYLYSTEEQYDSVEGFSGEGDTDLTSDFFSAFESDGSALLSYQEEPSRIYVGEGSDILLAAETYNPNESMFLVLFKTDQSADPLTGAPPTANAGSDQSLASIQTVTLNGSASSDPDSDAIQYFWEFESGPASVTLSNANAAQPTFTPSMEGTYLFTLVVYDGQYYSEEDWINVTVGSSSAQCPIGTYNYVEFLHFNPGGIGVGGGTLTFPQTCDGTATYSGNYTDETPAVVPASGSVTYTFNSSSGQITVVDSARSLTLNGYISSDYSTISLGDKSSGTGFQEFMVAAKTGGFNVSTGGAWGEVMLSHYMPLGEHTSCMSTVTVSSNVASTTGTCGSGDQSTPGSSNFAYTPPSVTYAVDSSSRADLNDADSSAQFHYGFISQDGELLVEVRTPDFDTYEMHLLVRRGTSYATGAANYYGAFFQEGAAQGLSSGESLYSLSSGTSASMFKYVNNSLLGANQTLSDTLTYSLNASTGEIGVSAPTTYQNVKGQVSESGNLTIFTGVGATQHFVELTLLQNPVQ